MKTTALLLICSLLSINTICSTPKTTLTENSHRKAINLAGFQKMLTQRMAKSYLALVAEVDTESNRTQLQSDIALFENNYKNIHRLLLSTETKEKIAIANILWKDYKSILKSPASIANAEKLLSVNTKILKQCNEVILAIETQAKKEGNLVLDALTNLTTIASHQRMLSQRITFYALAQKLDLDIDNTNVLLAASISEFQQSFLLLQESPNNTENIHIELSESITNWQQLLHYCTDETELRKESNISDISNSADLLQNKLDNVTRFYEYLTIPDNSSISISK